MEGQLTDKPKSLREHWFFGPVLRRSGAYTQVIVASICINMFALASAFFVMTVYDRVIPNESMDTLFLLTIGIGIVIIFDFLMKMVRGSLTDQAGLLIDEEVAETLFAHLSRNEKLIGTKSAGGVASVVKEFDTLKEIMASATLVAFADLPFIFIFLFVLYSLGGMIAAVPAIIVLSVIVVGLLIQPIIKRSTSHAQADGQNKQSVLIEVLVGLETIKTLRGIDMFRARWAKSVKQQGIMLGKTRFWSQISSNFAQTGQQLSQVGIVVYGVVLIAQAELTMGSLIACVILSGRVLAPMGQIANLLGRLNQAVVAYNNLTSLFALSSTETEREANLQHTHADGALHIAHMSLNYEGSTRPILASINLHIAAGERVGIIGKIGAGKSSLIKIMGGLTNPTEGLAQLDQVDITHLRPDDLRKHIGLLPQNATLFSGTLKENLLFGNPDADDDDIIKAAKIVGVDVIASELQNGYLTMLNEGGQRLSGGQRQAICIARTLLNEPQVILMDEPTSSMDNQTEAIFINNFKDWIGSKTLVVATHRGRLLDLVDRVIVIEGGRIVADGKKEDILRPPKPSAPNPEMTQSDVKVISS